MNEDAYEQLNASTSTPLLDDTALFAGITTQELCTSTFVDISSSSTFSTSVCSESYSPSNTDESVRLTPDEAADLLKALEASESSQTPSSQPNGSQPENYQVSATKQHKQRRKSNRKKCTNPNTGKMRNPSRERLQNELAYLRTKVVELESELKVLHVRKRSSSALIGAKNSYQGCPELSGRVWQRVAQRQAQGRGEAEAENKRLKSILEGQIQLAQTLEQVLHKRPNVSVFQDNPPPKETVPRQ